MSTIQSKNRAPAANNLMPRTNNLSTFRPTSRWGSNSIWNISNGPSVSGLGTAASARDSQASKDSTFNNLADESIEGKSGSSALVESSVSEGASWFRSSSFSSKITDRPPLDVNYGQQRDTTSSSLPQSYAVASRQPALTNLSNRNLQNTSLNGASVSKASFAGTFDAPITSASSDPPQVYTKFNQPAQLPTSRAVDSAWGDGTLVPSPVDERKSLSNASFGYQSHVSSRNSSLPPSRHSDVAPQYPVRNDGYADSQTAMMAFRNNSVSSASRLDASSAIRFDSPIDHMAAQFDQMCVGSVAHGTGHQQRPGNQPLTAHSPSTYDTIPTMARKPSYGNGGINFEAEDVENVTRAAYNGDSYSTHTPTDAINYHLAQYDFRNKGNVNQYSRQPSHYHGSAASHRAFEPSMTSQWHSSNISDNHAAALEHKLRSLPVQFQDPTFLHDSRQLAMLRASPQSMYGQYGSRDVAPLYNMPMYPNFPSGLNNGTLPLMDMGQVPRGPRELLDSCQGARSPLLEDFKQNIKTSKRYELKDIYNHVVEFSGDQHGSRFIQSKLESANSDEKERIFREMQPNALQLMTDVFGNYVIQKFFEHGDQTQKRALANKMKGHVRTLSLQMYGCRVVQKALDHILNDQQAALMQELKDDVIRCVKDQNGNHVIQKAIERCDAKDIDFIFNAFSNQIHTLSIHTYGCRVIQRCLEHREMSTRKAILRELQDSMPGLIGDAFGNYVVQHVVVHGEEHDKKMVLDLVIKGLEGYSKHKFASNVVEKCLTHSTDAWRREMIDIIIRGNRREGEGMLLGLIKDNYGNYVIQKLLDVLCERDYYIFMSTLQPEMNRAKRSGCGKQVMAIEKKMHRPIPYGSLQGSLPFGSQTISTATTPPPLTSDTRSIQTSSAASINGDAMEGALASRKGSVQSIEPTVFEFSH